MNEHDFSKMSRTDLIAALQQTVRELEVRGVDISASLELTSARSLADWMHTIFCLGEHGGEGDVCHFYQEVSWDDDFHKIWLDTAVRLMKYGSGEEIRTALENVYGSVYSMLGGLLVGKTPSTYVVDLLSLIERWGWMSTMAKRILVGKENARERQLAGANEKGLGTPEDGG